MPRTHCGPGACGRRADGVYWQRNFLPRSCAMKASELRGRAIVSLAEAQKLGEVDDVLLAPGQSRVAGLRIKHGLFGPTQYLPSGDIYSVGPDAITIQS